MSKRGIWLAVIAGALSGAAAAQEKTPSPAADTASEADPALRELADTCAARKFETIVVVAPGRGSKVKICGKPGQSDADWLVTLKDSMAKTQANQQMAPAVREQIVAALTTEVARLEAEAAANAVMPVKAAEAPIALPSNPVAASEPPPQYSALPPLPTPKRTARANLARGSGGVAAEPEEPLVRPNLTVRCALPRETFAACAGLRRETQLMVRAGDDIAAGTALRFLRSGDLRAEIDVGTLKKGQVLREKLPGRVCSGVLRGKVQVQVVTKGRVAETMGPYALYCGS